MKSLRLNRWHILAPIAVWWILFSVLSAFNYNRFQLLNIIGFPFLAIVPGLLTVILSRIKGLNFWAYAGLTLGFSLLELMVVGLLGNTFLPFAGIIRPLDKSPILLEVYLLVGILFATTWLRVKEVEVSVKHLIIFNKVRDYIFSFIPLIFVALSIFGAIRLNNGASNILTMIMLGGMGIYIIFLVLYAETLDENTIPTSIFFISLSLLLMTSLRGWYITGHDIQSEYKVFELAKSAGLWSMAAYRDAYNACLSITILPTIFSNMLDIPDPYIYKILFQIFFAFCPSILYLISRLWTNRTISFLAVVLFVGFPTFFTDMPFLNRQETAFLFYGLMLYAIFETKIPLAVRRSLFMLMGIGVILSHYSTTYTVLAIFGMAVVSRPIFVWLFKKYKERRFFKNSALVPRNDQPIGKPKITFVMIAILFALSFVWTSLITQTSNSVTSVLSQTFAAVKQGFGGDNRSVDVTTLLTFGKPNQTQELQDYIATTAGPIRNGAPTGEYYPSSTYSQYKLTVLDSETTPLTGLGIFFDRFGIDASNLIFIFGELLAKLTEILAPLGMFYLLIWSEIIPFVDDELYLIAFYCLVFIAMNIILPVISTDYGIFRALQQSMFVIAPIMVIGVMMVGAWILRFAKPIQKYVTVEGLAITFAGAVFFYSTHFLPYLFGNTPAALHLSNTGTYYDEYLIQSTEVTGVEWLTNIAATAANSANGIRLAVQTDRYSNNTFASLTSLNAYNDIYPGVIRQEGYVFLGPATVTKDRATVIYNADQVTYQYPTQFLANNKDLIYNNGGAEVYK